MVYSNLKKNSWGKQGAKLRMRTWAEGVEYLQGADGEEFYDVVVYNNKLYLCTKTHTSDSNNNPSASISGYLGFFFGNLLKNGLLSQQSYY